MDYINPKRLKVTYSATKIPSIVPGHSCGVSALRVLEVSLRVLQVS